jgi:microcystin-dependent protein
MTEPFIGEIRPFGFNFAPRGWAKCDGALQSVPQNQQLFTILGNRFGGDGRSNFALPNLTTGRTVIGAGDGPGLTPREIGETGGHSAVFLKGDMVPTHGHAMHGTADPAEAAAPANNAALARSTGKQAYAQATGQLSELQSAALAPANGGGQPHNNMMPYQAVNYCIALQGLYPPHK